MAKIRAALNSLGAGAGGHFGMFNGTTEDVLRLDVWSTPHGPHVTLPPAATSSGRSAAVLGEARGTAQNLRELTCAHAKRNPGEPPLHATV